MEEKLISEIHQLAERYIILIGRNAKDPVTAQSLIELLKRCEKALVGETSLDDETISLLNSNNNYDISSFISRSLEVLRRNPDGETANPWDITNPIINKLISRKISLSQGSLNYANRIIAEKFTGERNLDTTEFLNHLYMKGYSDKEIVTIVINYSDNPFLYRSYSRETKEQKIIETEFAKYVKDLIQHESKKFVLKGDNDYKKIIDKLIFGLNSSDRSFQWLYFSIKHFPASITNSLPNYLFYKDYQNEMTINYENLNLLIEHDASKIESLAIKIINELETDIGRKFPIYLALNKKQNGKYHNEIVKIGENHYNNAFKKNETSKYYNDVYTYNYGIYTTTEPLSIAYAQYLLTQNYDDGVKRIEKYILESEFLYPHFITFIGKQFEKDPVAYLIQALFKDAVNEDYYPTILNLLHKYELHPYLSRITEFMVQYASNKVRQQTARILSKYSEKVLPLATNLLTGKTVAQRITGALILSELNSEEASTTFNNAVDKEINDDTRDIMLEALSEKRFARPYSSAMVDDMIVKAEARKKLSKWNEKWIEEETLPKLYWVGGKKELSQTETRFLFYRMKRAKGINSDIEAKQLLNFIDRSSSNKFAKAILNAFLNSNSDNKFKYYLSLAGLLGDDDIMHNLVILFKKNIANNRVKMAECVIGALAMVGSNKALRIVEVIYRKFANKKPVISNAAKDALTAAADELNISMDELADRIIPNFDFEGLYKRFEVDGEEYRAFISSDFTIIYLNESNKIRKSLPANTPKELKSEFKEIEKEVRDIAKSQSGRLEKYMIEERRWSVSDWHEFFFMNPIMFVYAIKLVWGVFDKDNSLKDIFYCAEDSSLYNINDEEMVIDNDKFIGIIHPIYLTEEDRKKWHDKIYNMKLVTIFPQLERTIFNVDENEKEFNFSGRFSGKKVPKGADFVNTFMVKKNWYKCAGDGGSSEFTKSYKDQYKVNPYIEGPTVFYQGDNTPAIVHEVYFSTNDYNTKIKLKDLPPIFYSEVMSDIDQLIKAE